MLLPMRTLRRQEDPEQQRERLLLNTNAGSSPSVGALESAHSYDSIGDGPGIGRMIILNKTQQQQHQQDPTSNRRKSKQQRPNAIRNQKYSIITFVPLVFYEQVNNNLILFHHN
jgi:hypothetical protein